MSAKETNKEKIVKTLISSIQETFKKMSTVAFTKEPDFIERDIIEYSSRMRVCGLEKFNGPCLIGVINYYLNPKEQEVKNPCGALILYVEEENAAKMFKSLGYTVKDDDDEELILDYVGEFGNVIAEKFKNDLMAIGYSDIVFSPCEQFMNDIPEGVAFDYKEAKYHEASFHLWKNKILVTDVTFGDM